MKTCKSCRKWLATVCGVFGVALVAGAEQMPRLDDLAANIIKATIPTNHFRVDVSQMNDTTLTNGVAVKVSSSAISTQPNTKRSTYRLHYSHENGFKTEVVSPPAGTNVSTAATAPTANPRVSINIPNFLKKIQSWPTNSVTKEVWDGKACYKIAASSKNGAAEFWVDIETKCVLRVILEIQGSRFSESLLKYRLDKDHGWLLTSVDMSFAADGSHVRLEYGNYDFSQP